MMREDRSWMYIARRLREFENGVIDFLNVSFSKAVHGSQIRCPCKRCKNRYWLRRHEVYDHLKAFGFVETYYVWTFHGEDPLSTESIVENPEEQPNFNDNTNTLLDDRFRGCFEGPTNVQNGPNDEAKKFYKLLEEGQQELFPGCKNFSKLSFIIRLFLYKTLHGISNVAFNDLLQFHKKVPKSGSRQRAQYIPPRSVTRYSNYTRLRNQGQANRPQQGFELQQLFDKDQTRERQDDASNVNPSQKNDVRKMTMAEILKRNQLQREKETSTDVEQPSHFSPTEGDNMGVHYENSSQFERDQLIAACFGGDALTDSSSEGENSDTSHSSEEDPEDESEEINLDSRDLELDAILEGGTRGPTMLHDVHTRPFQKRVAIILNEYGQPIGPIDQKKDIVGQFARFLGTLARDYSYAPLVFDSWRKVPNKDKLWEYVLTKYIVPDEGKDWVMKTIRDAWRVHKSRFKKKHFYRYNDDKSRWQNRSNLVPDDDFLKLLAKWKKKSEKKRCSRNRDRRLAQKNMHTAGPKSFARIREELTNEDPDKEPPSLAKLFEHTRARKPGKKYKESYDDTEKKITEMKTYVPDDGECPTDPFLGVMGKEYDGRRRLFGRGVCNKKLKEVNGTQTSYVVPGEVLESLKTSLREDMRKDMEYEISRQNKEQEEEYFKRKAELESMEKNIENQRDLMREQILTKFLERLPPDVVKEYLS